MSIRERSLSLIVRFPQILGDFIGFMSVEGYIALANATSLTRSAIIEFGMQIPPGMSPEKQLLLGKRNSVGRKGRVRVTLVCGWRVTSLKWRVTNDLLNLGMDAIKRNKGGC